MNFPFGQSFISKPYSAPSPQKISTALANCVLELLFNWLGYLQAVSIWALFHAKNIFTLSIILSFLPGNWSPFFFLFSWKGANVCVLFDCPYEYDLQFICQCLADYYMRISLHYTYVFGPVFCENDMYNLIAVLHAAAVGTATDGKGLAHESF